MDWSRTVSIAVGVGMNLLLVVVLGAYVVDVDLYSVLPVRTVEQWVAGVPVSLRGIELLYLVLGTGFGISGLVSLGRGLPAYGRAYTLWTRDPVQVEDLHLQGDTVEVEGTAEVVAAYGTVASTYTGTECLAFESEQKERRVAHDRDRADDWRVTEHCREFRPFQVADGTGTVTVDPRRATFSFDRDVVTNSGRTIETEWRLEPGEQVYVSGRKCDGTTDESAPGDVATYVGVGDGDDADGSFTISDASERWTVLRFAAKGTLLSVLGLVFCGVGAAMLTVLVLG